MNFAGMMVVAMLLDLALGWPAPIYAKIGHPVTWIGAMIDWIDARFNVETESNFARRMAGVATLVIVVALTALPMIIAQALLPASGVGMVLGGILAWPFVAMRSMYVHVKAVLTPLQTGELAAAQNAVSMIVGRDPSVLTQEGVARAALESLAENSSDGIVAPLFWGLVFGLPGIAAYKAVNTLDSMIGHRNARFEYFGWASARFDDLVNLLPARLTGALFAVVSDNPRQAFAVMRRDAGLHRSPNAGWPEAAMASALSVRLSGPRIYGNRVAEEPWVNEGAADPTASELAQGLAIYRKAMAVLGAAFVAIAILVWLWGGR